MRRVEQNGFLSAGPRLWACGLRSVISVALSLSFLFSAYLGALPVSALETKFAEATEIQVLPGGLNAVSVFNSNSPEMILEEGVLLSTFPNAQMAHPECHLNYTFDGRFDIFSHHVTRADTDTDERVLWLGFIVGNPSNKKVRLQVLGGASYLSQPDAPFITLPDLVNNDDGTIYAGPGDRVSNEVLREIEPTFIPKTIGLEPGESKVILSLPLPVRKLRPALNGRSTILQLRSTEPVHLATVSKFVFPPQGESGPTDPEWIEALHTFKIAGPRDKSPTPPFSQTGPNIYGRVAGVVRGNEWNATITDSSLPDLQIIPKFEPLADLPFGRRAVLEPAPAVIDPDEGKTTQNLNAKKEKGKNRKTPSKFLSLPAIDSSISFPLCTVNRGTFGTGQLQAAPVLVGYADTAYLANGNYGVTYRINFPLHNPHSETVNAKIVFRSPVKSDERKQELTYYKDAPPRAFFRGTVKVTVDGKTNFWHLVQKQGSEGSNLAEIEMPAGSRKKVDVEFIYPADATPPHVLSVVTVRKPVEVEGK